MAATSILKAIFKKDTFQEISESEITVLLQQYPYFAHLQWLQAAKKKAGKDALPEDFLLKKAVFVFRPRRFQQFIRHPFAENKEEKLPEKPLLQPLYTEDYFAYTRTKLPKNIENDKPPTMEQVRSFTGWLRTMKRPETAENTSNRVPETAESGKEGSLRNEEVFTESMAEIRVKHGQANEAIAIYNKLILLNPEKKSYFAAKISALKKQ